MPITLTVTAAPPKQCPTDDSIFCDGFDGAATSGIVSGAIEQAAAQNGDGSAFDFIQQGWHGYNRTITADDIDPYYMKSGGSDGGSAGMYVSRGDVAADGPVGGVVDSVDADSALLRSGDMVDPVLRSLRHIDLES